MQYSVRLSSQGGLDHEVALEDMHVIRSHHGLPLVTGDR